MTYDYNILGGSIFMDYRNKLADQNIIIYGHHFSKSGGNDPERIKAFTPLEKALDKEKIVVNYHNLTILIIFLIDKLRFADAIRDALGLYFVTFL